MREWYLVGGRFVLEGRLLENCTCSRVLFILLLKIALHLFISLWIGSPGQWVIITNRVFSEWYLWCVRLIVRNIKLLAQL